MGMARLSSSRLDASSDSSFHRRADELEEEALLRPLFPKSTLSEPRGRQDSPILTRSDSTDGHWSPYLRDLHVLSFSFLFIFLAYCAVQNLESSINTDQGLGSAALGVLYLSLTISSLGAPLVVIRMGAKRALLLGLSGYWAFITANLCPSWYTLIPAALLLGFTASILWVAEGTYLTFVAKSHAAACNISEATALGIFNGEFWGVFSANQVLGNLLTLALLQFGNKGSTSASTPKIFVAFLASLAVGTILLCLLKPYSEAKEVLPIAQDMVIPPKHGSAKASFALLSEKKMVLLIFLLLYTGMQQAFIWGDFTKDVVTSTLGLSWVGGVMAAYGAADTLGSFLAGRNSSGLVSISIILSGGAFCQILVLAALFLRGA